MDVEKRLRLAAAPLKKEVAEFDGDSFSRQLYARLGITPSNEAMNQGSGTDRHMSVGPRPGGHRHQGQDH